MRDVFFALLMINTLYTPYATMEMNFDDKQDRVGIVYGDFIIGALFSIRKTPNITAENNTFRCGKVRDQYGMQRVEAALWAIENINREKKILPNYTLGIEIRDTCWNPRLALRQSLKFIDFCPTGTPEINTSSIIGVIGPPSSEETYEVRNLLRIFQIPQIGFSATSAKLSEQSARDKSDYFVRVVPSDRNQALVMIRILQRYNWTYVNAVSTEGTYGGNGLTEFRQLAEKNSICIDKVVNIKSDSDEEYDKCLNTFRQTSGSRVIICFCEGETVRGLLLAANRSHETHKYIFIGSDGWAGRDDIVQNLNAEAAGNLMIRIHANIVTNFKDYYFKMNERVNSNRNPWIEDFYNERFNCTLKNTSKLWPPCSGKEWNDADYVEDPKLSFIIKSIYVFAHALANFTKKVCENVKKVSCQKFVNDPNNSFMNDYVKNVEFRYNSSEIIKFDDVGDSQYFSYEILNYQNVNGTYKYEKVGRWLNDTLQLNVSAIKLPNNKLSIKSVCSEPCRSGQRKEIFDSTKQCCWKCVDCPEDYFSDGNNCTACSEKMMPNNNKTGCVKKNVEYNSWWEAGTLVCISISVVGISVSLLSAVVFYKFRQTPVVRFSSRELSYIMYSGMIIAYGSSFLVLAKPSTSVCILVRFMPGLSLTMIYGPLMVKTNRISRIFSMSKKRFPKLRPKYMSIKFQILACVALIIMELIICAVHMKYHYPSVEDVEYSTKIIPRCQHHPHEITSPHFLNAILLVFCTFYAFKTRSLPDNFNEAKLIAFSCYATLITWSAFFIIYYQTPEFQAVSLSLVLAASSLIIQICLFVPKLYIILWRPEKNQRSNFVTAKGMRIHVGSTDSTYVREYFIRRGDLAESVYASVDDKNSRNNSRSCDLRSLSK